ncbi:MAG: hypothetical protein CME38_04240 [Haliea sp.]|nr:hypothetical protein [Haliea sp.]
MDRQGANQGSGRMHHFGTLLLATALLSHGALAGGNTADSTASTRTEEARALVGRFVGQLKPQLQQAMAAGGPAQAVAVCAEVAPALMDSLSAETGWQVRRVSLQARNAERAEPDAWERAVLQQFAARQAAGTPASQLQQAAVTDGRFRYMQAQGTEGLCLACHGETLSPAVQEALDTHYPDDRATGYQLGEVRGAISLIAPAS